MSGLPDVLNVKPMASIDTMNVDTNILDPIVINSGFARFVLERKGILDAGSTFSISAHPVVAGDDQCWLPVKTGAHALIKRAVLKVGTKVISSSDDYGYYQTMRRAFKTCEEKGQKDSVKVGSLDNMCPDEQGTGLYQLKDVRYPTVAAGAVPAFLRLRNDPALGPVFQIKLSDLFPMMRNMMLPLYLIDTQVSIELTFNTQTANQTGRMAVFSSAYAGDTSMSIGLNNVQFLADYLTYQDERMDATAKLVMSDRGLSIPYEDTVLTSSNIPAATGGNIPAGATVRRVQVTRDLGLSGRNVRAVVLHDSSDVVNPLVGVYGAQAYDVPDEYNYRINDQLVYSRDVVNEQRKQNQLSDVFGTNINCLNAEYSKNGQTDRQTPPHAVNNHMISTNTLNGVNQQVLEAQCHFEGVDLTTDPLVQVGSGTLVGQKPIESLRTIYQTANDNHNRELRYFALVERAMVLKGGQVMVSA
tara:strand:+ start:4719 stop:6134 length:1416 start_codon:yes stop_codon:yes gene_type:complete